MKNPLENYPDLLTDNVFLIGNGSSRKKFNLDMLRGKGTIIGCNALYRDFTPDILICNDTKMTVELNRNKYLGLTLSGTGSAVHTSKRLKWKVADARTSGVFGLRFITKVMHPSKCYMLGMDGYFGNVYEGTENYKVEDREKFYKKIVQQYVKVVNNSKVEIINVNHKDSWNISNTSNYRHISYNEFYTELGA